MPSDNRAARVIAVPGVLENGDSPEQVIKGSPPKGGPHLRWWGSFQHEDLKDMTSRDFCYWLQGYFEIGNATGDPIPQELCSAQVDCIRSHLAMVFKHEIDPSMGPKEHQLDLSKLHQMPLGGSLLSPYPQGLINC